MNVYNYILTTYGYNEPLFIDELTIKLNIETAQLIRILDNLLKSDYISQYPYFEGVYFIAKPNKWFKTDLIAEDKIIERRYIKNKSERIGYITGLSLINRLGLTTQLPGITEIVSKRATRPKTIVKLKTERIILTMPKTRDITDENYKLLQILDIITKLEMYTDEPTTTINPFIKDYLKDVNLALHQYHKISKAYPFTTLKKARELNIFNFT